MKLPIEPRKSLKSASPSPLKIQQTEENTPSPLKDIKEELEDSLELDNTSLEEFRKKYGQKVKETPDSDEVLNEIDFDVENHPLLRQGTQALREKLLEADKLKLDEELKEMENEYKIEQSGSLDSIDKKWQQMLNNQDDSFEQALSSGSEKDQNLQKTNPERS